MAIRRVSIPIKVLNNKQWGDLNSLGDKHEFCAESVKLKNESFSFAGNHRVRLWVAKKNVHWKIPDSAQIVDLSEVAPALPPRRIPRRQR